MLGNYGDCDYGVCVVMDKRTEQRLVKMLEHFEQEQAAKAEALPSIMPIVILSLFTAIVLVVVVVAGLMR